VIRSFLKIKVLLAARTRGLLFRLKYKKASDASFPEPINLLPLKNLKKLRVLKLPNFKQVENQDILKELPLLENQDILDVSPLLVKSSDLDQGRRMEQQQGPIW
jgi:hypothetical protein